MTENLEPFYPHNTQFIDNTKLVFADGIVGKDDGGEKFDGVQVASRNIKTGRRYIFSGFKNIDLSGIKKYESYKMGIKRNGQKHVDTRRFGEWISKADYDRLTQK